MGFAIYQLKNTLLNNLIDIENKTGFPKDDYDRQRRCNYMAHENLKYVSSIMISNFKL